MLVSFKLETDALLLEDKIRKAIKENGSDFVVGNLLQNRFSEVWIYSTQLKERILRSEPTQAIEIDLVRRLHQLLTST